MKNNTERKLRKLFDFQRFEQEPELQKVIDSVLNKYSNIVRLSDNDLELAVAGTGATDPPDEKTFCPHCNKTVEVVTDLKGKRHCKECNTEL